MVGESQVFNHQESVWCKADLTQHHSIIAMYEHPNNPHIMQPWDLSPEAATTTYIFPQWSLTTLLTRGQEQRVYLAGRYLNDCS